MYIASRVLHHLGRHEEADELWERWEAEHHDVRFYYLPLGGDWVGLSDQALHSVADSLVDALVQQPWPELEGFQLLNIPGFAYLHAEHREVERLAGQLAVGDTATADARWVTAAAVLAAAATPALHDQILEAARRSIRGIGERAVAAERPRPRQAPVLEKPRIGDALVASLTQPDAIQDAIILGAALTPYHPPRRRNWGQTPFPRG